MRPSTPLHILEQFQKKLVETKKALGAHLENISDIGSNDVNQKDEKFKQLMTNLFETKDSTTALKLSEEGQYSELIGTKVIVFKGTPKVAMRLKAYASIKVPQKGAKSKEFSRYRKSLESSRSLRAPYRTHRQKSYTVR